MIQAPFGHNAEVSGRQSKEAFVKATKQTYQ